MGGNKMKTKNIYKGPVRKIVVSKLEINDGMLQLAEYETPVVKKDALFYRGLFNEFISFDCNTILPDKEEAIDHVKELIELLQARKAPFPSCDFVNESEIKFSHQVSKQEFKTLKKEYKEIRRMKRQKRK